MFGDFSWIGDRTGRQEARFGRFLEGCQGQDAVVVEIGAGTSIPTIRNLSERVGGRKGTTVIRINPREPRIDAPHLSIAEGAVAALGGIDAALREGVRSTP
jgi:hypothetical protein